MKAFIISLLLCIPLSAIAEKGDKLVGIWAEPSKANPDTLWYLYEDGRAITSSNTFFKKLRWYAQDATLYITDDNPNGHTWEARYRKNIARGTHAYSIENNLNYSSFYAEKISDKPNKLVDFYTVCGNTDGRFEIVNTGRFDQCQSFLPMEFISSFNIQEAKVLCE